MLGDADVVPDYDEAAVQNAFRGVGFQTATKVLQDRLITYIGINEHDHSVVIYTQKSLRGGDIKAFGSSIRQSVNIVIRHAGQLSSGLVPPPPQFVTLFSRHNDAYTCGSSISIANEHSAGTLGCLARNAAGEIFGISNNHVFAANNYAEIGIPVSVPGLADVAANSLDPFVIGHLYQAIPIADGNPQIVDAISNVDAAIIKIADAARVTSMQREYYDTPSSVMPIAANMQVEKVGRTTGRTRGVVTSHHITPQAIRCNIIKYNSFKLAYFSDFYGVTSPNTTPFSVGGDSGALVTTTDASGNRFAVGIVFAGSDNLSFVIPISRVLTHFDLQLVSQHNT